MDIDKLIASLTAQATEEFNASYATDVSRASDRHMIVGSVLLGIAKALLSARLGKPLDAQT